MIISIDQLFDEIDRHFLDVSKLRHYEIFADKVRNIEGWFKGELFYLFASLEKDQAFRDWKYEIALKDILNRPEKGIIDFKVTINGEPIYLEMKTVLSSGQQGKSAIDASLFFDPNPSSGYIGSDAHKLAKIGQGYCLLFVYPFPQKLERWQRIVENFVRRMAQVNIDVAEISIPNKRYPSSLYISKLKVAARNLL